MVLFNAASLNLLTGVARKTLEVFYKKIMSFLVGAGGCLKQQVICYLQTKKTAL
jgi:hypothetical protein